MNIRDNAFRARGFTPVPFIAASLYWAELNWAVFLSGLLFAFSGELLRINAIRYAGGSTRTREVGADSLVTGGPYSYTRNPLYVGNMMIYTGFAFASGAVFPYLPVIAFFFFGLQYTLIVSLEEQTLKSIFGNSYIEYSKKVPRIFPRFSPLIAPTQAMHGYSSALKEERRTLQGFIIVWILLIFRLGAF